MRARALLIDVLIITTAALFSVLVTSGAGAEGEITAASLSVIVSIGIVTYNVVLLARSGAANGQTVGKHAVGIRVVRTDGGALTFSDVLRREALGKALLSIVPFYNIVDMLWPLNDPQRQAIHDKIGGTLVILASGPPLPDVVSLDDDVDLGDFLPPAPPPRD